MCGISGYISNKNLIRKESINSTLNLMSRRGPDSKNFYLKSYDNKDLALLMSTSGTTGNPKLVRLTYQNYKDNTEKIIKSLSHA